MSSSKSLPSTAPRGKAFAVFRLTHVATVQPLIVACRNCGGAEYSIEGGPCPACKGTGSHAVRRPLKQPAVIRVPGEWLALAEAEKIVKGIDGRLTPVIDLIARGAA